MNKKNCCLTVLLLLSFGSMGQVERYQKYKEYRDTVVAATARLNEAAQRGDMAAADIHFATHFRYFQMMDSVLPIQDFKDLCNYYRASEYSADTARARQLLFRIVDNKLCDKPYLDELRDFFHLEQRPYWDSLSTIVYARPCRNVAYAAELDSMAEEDQRVRNEWNKPGVDHDSIVHETWVTDSIHIARLKELIQQYGFPTYSRVGSKGSSNASLLAQHSEPEFLAWFLPQAKMAFADKDFCVNWIPLMDDRDRSYHGLPQLYGTQLFQLKTNEQAYFQPIADMDHLLLRRYQVGLDDISSYCGLWGLDSVIIHPYYLDYSSHHQVMAQARVALAQGDTVKAINLLGYPTLYPFMRDMHLLHRLLVSTGQDSLANECRSRMIRCGYLPTDDTTALTRCFMADYRAQLNTDWSAELRTALKSADAFSAFLQKEHPRYSTEAWEESATIEGLERILLSLSKKEAMHFLDILRKQVTKGNLHPEDYAQLYDIVFHRDHGKSYYGTLQSVKPYCPRKLDKRRESLGLPPLWVSAQLSNTQLPNK